MKPLRTTPDVSTERRFERKEILAQKQRYLATDVVDKVLKDDGYLAKVQLVERALDGVRGWILDVGANTCGEAEYLTTKGYSIIATDINEIALGISKERAALYGRAAPAYVAADAHRLPIADGSIAFVVVYEALHHMPEPQKVLSEINRVLVEGGGLFLFEPYAYNPYRRVAEVKERFRRVETVEKSFGVRELTDLVRGAGLRLTSLEHKVLPPSRWKMDAQISLHRGAKRVYHAVSVLLPRVFGNLVVVAEKPGRDMEPLNGSSFEALLRCPVSGHPVVRTAQGLTCVNEDCRARYPSYAAIPVLVEADGVRLEHAAWKRELAEGTQAGPEHGPN